MSPQPPVDREVVAERLGWPADTLGAFIDLQDDYPDWDVRWTPDRRAGFRASLNVHITRELGAATPRALREQIEAVAAELRRLVRPDVAPGLTVQVEDALGNVQGRHHWTGGAR